MWLWLASPLIGLMLGLFGAGGGMLTVPLLIFGAGLSVKQSIAASVWIVGGVSVVAAVQQRAWRVLRWDLLVFFGLGGLFGGIGGAWLGARIPAALQQVLFALLLWAVAVWTWRARLHDAPAAAPHCRCPLALVAGVAMGLLTGLLGVGGGFLMVPILIALGISHFPTAVAHSLALIAVNAAASGITYLGIIPSDGRLLLTVGLLAAAGSVAGSHLLKRLPRRPLQRGFAVILAVLGGVMLMQLI